MKSSRCPARFTLRALAAIALSAVGMSAQALVIQATLAAGFTAAEQATINAAINVFQTTFTDPYTVKIDFTHDPIGLGGSNTWITTLTYATVHNALIADATTASDATANSHLSAVDPIFSRIILSNAECRAIQLGCGFGPDGFDGTININTTLTDADRSNGISANLYDMQAVVMHEIDEVLGSGSWIGQGSTIIGRTQDLFRYTAGPAGIRTFTAAGNNAYFSIDGGVTDLARFNQQAGPDYGDYFSCFPDAAPGLFVQNACGTPGVIVNYSNVEATMMDVIGWNRVQQTVPEPGSLALLGIALSGFVWRRRKQ